MRRALDLVHFTAKEGVTECAARHGMATANSAANNGMGQMHGVDEQVRMVQFLHMK